jgi:16S rRNA (guanine966-N2)-methyltransferase
MSKSHRANPSNQVRIIGGDWRGRKLQFPSIEGLRPTPDRVRETLFNWLSPHIADAHCVDLYAGSGALGFEALSRGARSCYFIDNNKQVRAALASSVQALNCEDRATITLADSASAITLDTSIDLVFLDPPFASHLFANTLDWLLKSPSIHPETLIYIESPKGHELPVCGLSVSREKIAGEVISRLVRID